VEGAAGSVSTLAPMRAMDDCVAVDGLSTLDDFLAPNSFRLSFIDWKNVDAAELSLDDDDKGFAEDVDAAPTPTSLAAGAASCGAAIAARKTSSVPEGRTSEVIRRDGSYGYSS
jgi:hypothetical protein